MSASPSAPATGGTPTGGTPNANGGVPLKIIRRPAKVVDPLVRPKPRRAPNALSNAPTSGSVAKVNGNATAPAPKLPTQVKQQPPQNAAKNAASAASKPSAATPAKPEPPKDPHGFSEPPKSAEKTFYWPLYTTKREIMEGLRHHVAKFWSKKVIDLTNEDKFTRPIRLHRRDPRAPPGGGAAGGAKDHRSPTDSKEAIVDDKERERQEILQQQREAQKQADLAQIAPTASQAGATKKAAFKKKTRQVYRNDADPEAEKASKLRYEESLPWHVEDFDNKNTWVGSYESALSDIHVALTVGQNCFYMYPIEKWYKFTPKNQFNALTIEEAESRMSKKVKEPRWFMESRQAELQKREEAENRRKGSKLFLGKWENATAGRSSITALKSEFADSNDLDYEEDRFADDEENQLFEGEEEDAKQAESRIKRDQLKANIFGLKEEKEYDQEADEEKKELELEKRLGRSIQKALIKREGNHIYTNDDSDANPYSDESDSDDSDEEKRKEEERKKGEEKSDKATNKEKESSKQPSGASTKGTNTPSGRNKHVDPLKKAASTLKRPGSPNLSEVSGTESARKKSKKKHGSSQPTATSTPVPGSRATSPAPPPSSAPEATRTTAAVPPPRSTSGSLSAEPSKANEKSKSSKGDKKRRRAPAGSGSDGDATGGDISDAGNRNQAKRHRPSPRSGSPQGSRATSPIPVPARQGSVAGSTSSRPGSPIAGSPAAGAEVLQPISAAEIMASIPPEGTTIGELITLFKRRVGQDRRPFIALVMRYSYLDKTTKKLRPKIPGGAGSGSDAPSPSSAT